MTSSTDNKTEGKMDDLKGKAKETWGNATGNDEDVAEGKGDQVKGHAKQAWGHVKDAAHSATDKD